MFIVFLVAFLVFFFFFKQKTAYEMRISDWSSDVCSSDLRITRPIAEWEAAWTTDGPKYPGGSFMGSYCSHTDMFNWLKFPAISVPCGFVDGFPVGLQIAGPPGSEAKIFRVALAYQTAFRSEERRVGQEAVSTSRTGWSPCQEKTRQ